MNTKQINIGIIGVGDVTLNRHIPSIRSLKDDNARILGLADTIPGRARKYAELNGIPIAVEDYKELLDNRDINAIAVCTPVSSHKMLAVESIRAGKHVYLEKPATLDAQEMQEVMDAAAGTDKIFIVGSNGLLQRQMRLFKSMIDKKELGEVFLISVERASSRMNDYVSVAGRKAESGIALHSASHNIEWALYFLGDPKPVSVLTRGYYRHGNISKPGYRDDELEDCCISMIEFANGASFFYKAMRGAAAQKEYVVKIHGDMGTIVYDVDECYYGKSDAPVRMVRDVPAMGMQQVTPLTKFGKTHEDMYRHFFECIRRNEKSMSDGHRALVVMRILDAMARSMKAGGKQVPIE